MKTAELVQQRIFESWQYYQRELIRVISPLTGEQLNLRVVPSQRSLGELAVHIVYGRAKWALSVLDAPDLELELLLAWEEPGDQPPTSTQIVQGLDLTWQRFTALIDCWSSIPTETALSEREVDGLQTIWGMLEHDLHHGGELSFCLGACGLVAPDM